MGSGSAPEAIGDERRDAPIAPEARRPRAEPAASCAHRRPSRSGPDALWRAHAQAQADRVPAPADDVAARVVAALLARAPAGRGEVVQRRPAAMGISVSGAPAGTRIQRFPGSGYYLVCGKNEAGATVVENDPVKPPRYYRTVDRLPAKAVAAPSQPFRLWYLYEVPTATTAVTPTTTAPNKTTTATPTATQEAGKKPGAKEQPGQTTSSGNGSTPVGTAAASTKQNTKKKKKASEPSVGEKSSVTKTAEREIPFEEMWQAKVRKLATEQGMQRPDIDELIKKFAERLARYPKELETALTELAAAWKPEFVSGLETSTLETRQQSLRAAWPTWDGNPHTIESVLKSMSDAVTSAEKAVVLLKKAGSISSAVGAVCFADLLSQWNLYQAVNYADDIGHERLKVLMTERRLTAEVLKHYGFEKLKGFRGAGVQVWLHLTEAKLSAKLDVSGAHDDHTFRDFISRKTVNYAIIDDPYPALRVVRSLIPKPTLVGEVPQVVPALPQRGEVYTVRYTEADDLGHPRRNGTVAYKTLINGLEKDQATWMTRFDQAIWHAIAARTFPMAAGGLFFGTDAEGQEYKGYYTKGNEVDTLFPFI